MLDDEAPEYTEEDKAAWMALLGQIGPSPVKPDPECMNCVQLHALFHQHADFAGDTIACALHSFKFEATDVKLDS